ncbi:MAG: hypothetical protein Q8N91_01200 [Candidatus Omnitrophota bacterium]|nr:hypothetical protein [Candidatus Omnitrophota bacterium]
MSLSWVVSKMRGKNNVFTKVVSILIIQSFILSNVAFAEPGTSKSVTEAKRDCFAPSGLAMTVVDPEKVVIPREFGLVKSKFIGNDGRLVIHIQDAHCNYEAQANIVKILENLVKNYNITLVSVEGADGVIDTSWFKAFPDEEIRKEVATYFMKKGEITGPEFLSITSDYSIKLFGAETRSYYIENLNAFTSSYPLKEETEKYYNRIKNVLNRLKGSIYTSDLKAMDAKSDEYESKKIQFNEYVRFLQEMAERQKISLRGYENFFKLVSTLIYEKKIDFTVTDKERGTLIDELSKKISKEALTELVTQSIAFKAGKISSVEYYHYLRGLAIKNGIDLAKDFPNLYNYIIYNSVYSRIENEALFNDIKKVEADIKERLFKTEDQRILEKLSRHVNIILGLINIKLLNGDFEYYEKKKEEFSYEAFTDFIKKKTIQYGFAYEIEPPSDAVANSIPKLQDFYSIALKRDKALVDNTLNAMKKEKQKLVVLITGGFHSEGIAKLLEKQGVSYMVVCPSITKDAPTPYIQILTNQRTPLEDILVNAPTPETKQGGGMLAPYIISGAKQLTKREIAEIDKAVSKVNEQGLADRLEDFEYKWVKSYINIWISRAEKFAGKRSLSRDREILEQAFRIAVDSAVAKNKISRENRDLVHRLAAAAFEEIFKARETEFTQRVKTSARRAELERTRTDNVGGSETKSPGTGAVRSTEPDIPYTETVDFNEPYTQEDAVRIGMAIEATAKALANENKLREVFEHRTGGVFVVLDDAAYMKFAAQYNAPSDMICHPGTRKTRLEYEKDPRPETYGAKVKRYYYIKESLFDELTDEERLVFAMHEEMHIKIALKIIKKAPDGESEERVINRQEGCDIRPIMARFGSIPHMADKLLTDTAYGDAAIGEIERLKRKGAAAELAEFVKRVYQRRVYIDKMKSVLTEEPYTGYDVVIISSTTEGEAAEQAKNIKAAFANVRTKNSVLKNEVCVLSILDSAEGGQIIGQNNTWDKAVKDAFNKWAEGNDILPTFRNLEKLQAQGMVKIATYHNGGKAERFSPAGQSFNLSRADQPLVGHVLNAQGKAIPLNLLLAVILSTSSNAETNDGSHHDVYWTNQIGFGTNREITRGDFAISKFAIAVPENPNKKDLFDYGTIITSEDGRILKFVARGRLTEKNYATGRYDPNPDYKAQLDELLEAVREGRAYFDYGSFSMTRDMQDALFVYWRDVKKIFDMMRERGGKAGISRDLDPMFIQILAPLINGLIGRESQLADLPDAAGLDAAGDKDAMLENIYNSLVGIMEPEYRAVFEDIHRRAKGDFEKGNDQPLQAIYETIEFFIRYRGRVFKDLKKAMGIIDFGPDSHWFAYKRLLDMANEKFFMLADIMGETMELEPNGNDLRAPAEIADIIRAEDARRLRRIRDDAVCAFEVDGRKVILTSEQVRDGWEGNGVKVKGSIVQGNTVLLKGSAIIDSVINNSQGKIMAKNSYVELATAPVINAKNSIVVKAAYKEPIIADREIVADAFRETIQDTRFPKGQTRMRAPVGYDPKPTDKTLAETMSDKVKFGDNAYSFEAVRDEPCERAANDAIEASIRDSVMKDIRAEIKNRRTKLALEKVKGIFEPAAANARADEKTLQVALSNINQWLTEDRFKEYYEALLDLIDTAQTDAKVAMELYDSFWRTIPFGTGGRRYKIGIGPNRMNAYMVAMTAQGHVEYLKSQYPNEVKRGDAAIGAWDIRAFHKYFAEVESLRKYREIIEEKCPALKGLSSEDLSKIAGLVYAGNGIRYIHSKEMRSTPWLSFAVNRFSDIVKGKPFVGEIGPVLNGIQNVMAGIVLSSSHNPYDNNGTKFYENSGAQAPPQIVQKLMNLGDMVTAINYFGGDIIYTKGLKAAFDEAVKSGTITVLEGENLRIIDNAYIDSAIEEIKSVYSEKEWDALKPWFEKLSVSFNAINGTGVTNVVPILEKLKFQVLRSRGDVPTWEFTEGDGNIPNPEFEPTFNTGMQIGVRRTLDALFTGELKDVTGIKSVIDSDNKVIPISALEAENRGPFTSTDRLLEHVRTSRAKFIRGLVLDVNDANEEAIRVFSLENNICLLTDPDADRVGLGMLKVERVGGEMRLHWVSANDNDEAGIVLFRHRLERLRDMAKRGELIRYIEDRRREEGRALSKSGRYQLIMVNTVVSNTLEKTIAETISREIYSLTNGMVSVKIITHHVGFKFTGEIIDNILTLRLNGITGELMKRAGITPDNIDESFFVMSSEEGEGSLVGYRGSIDKDSGTTGLALAVLTAEQFAKGRTMYDYLVETYELYGYSKTYLEPMVMTGGYGFKMINEKIMTRLRDEVFPAVLSPTPENEGLRRWGRFVLVNGMDHYNIMKNSADFAVYIKYLLSNADSFTQLLMSELKIKREHEVLIRRVISNPGFINELNSLEKILRDECGLTPQAAALVKGLIKNPEAKTVIDNPWLWPQAIRESVNILEFYAILPDGTRVTIVARPSGTEPKHKNLVMIVGNPLKAGEKLGDYVKQINNLNREVMDEVMIACYSASDAEYQSGVSEKQGLYRIKDLDKEGLMELLRIEPIIISCEAKLAIYFPLRDWIVELSNTMARLTGRDEFESQYGKARKKIEEYLMNFKEKNGVEFVERSVLMNLRRHIIDLPEGVAMDDDRVKSVYVQAILWFGRDIGEKHFVKLLEEHWGLNEDVIRNGMPLLSGPIQQVSPAAEATDTPGRGAVRAPDQPLSNPQTIVEEVPRNLSYIPEHIAAKILQNRSADSAANAARGLFAENTYPSAGMLCGISNILLDNLKRDKALAAVLAAFFRGITAGSAAMDRSHAEEARDLGLIAGQALNIISWATRNIAGAEDIRLTDNEGAMAKSDKGKSFLDKSAMPVIVAIKEGVPGFHYRGVEGIGNAQGLKNKMGVNIAPEAIYDNAKLESARNNFWLYLMDHGFMAAPRELQVMAANGSMSTIHETAFLASMLPGSIQYASTGPGHFQKTQLDVKYVTEGRGIQYNKFYNEKGGLVAVFAQVLKPGSWAVALPFAVDSVETLSEEGLEFTRFNDFSVEVPNPEEWMQMNFPNLGIDFRAVERAENTSQVVTRAAETVPYCAVNVNGRPALVQNVANAPAITWVSGIPAPAATLTEFYKRLNQAKIEELLGIIARTIRDNKWVTNEKDKTVETITAVNPNYMKSLAALNIVVKEGKPLPIRPCFKLGIDGYTWGEPIEESSILARMSIPKEERVNFIVENLTEQQRAGYAAQYFKETGQPEAKEAFDRWLRETGVRRDVIGERWFGAGVIDVGTGYNLPIEVLSLWPEEVFGASTVTESGVTAKHLTSARPLSVQYHRFPEMIVPLEGGYAFIGSSRPVGGEGFVRALQEGDESVLARATIVKDQPIIVPPGMPHAYGKVEVYEVKGVTPVQDSKGTISFYDRLKLNDREREIAAEILQKAGKGEITEEAAAGLLVKEGLARQNKDVATMTDKDGKVDKKRIEGIAAELDRYGHSKEAAAEKAAQRPVPASPEFEGKATRCEIMGSTKSFVSLKYTVEAGESMQCNAGTVGTFHTLFVAQGKVSIHDKMTDELKYELQEGEEKTIYAKELGVYDIRAMEKEAVVYTQYKPSAIAVSKAGVTVPQAGQLAPPGPSSFTGEKGSAAMPAKVKEALESSGLEAMINAEREEYARELALCTAATQDRDAILIVAVDTDIYGGKAQYAISGLAGEVNGNTKPGSIVIIAGKGRELSAKIDEALHSANTHNLSVRKVVTQLSAANAAGGIDKVLSEKGYVLKVTVDKDLSGYYMQIIRLFKLCFQIGYYDVDTGQGVDRIKETLAMIMGRAIADNELTAWLANKIIEILPRLEKIDLEATAVEAYKAVKKALTSL